MGSIYNVIIVGDAGVGKTAFIRQLLQQSFSAEYEPSIGSSMYEIVMDTITINIWDTAGQEKFNPLSLDSSDIHGVLILFDVASMLSFQSVPWWVNKIGCNINVICGNKCDIQQRKVQSESMPPNSREISTKTGDNVMETLLYLIGQIAGDD